MARRRETGATLKEFDYKQRPFSRRVSQDEWDQIFSTYPAGTASAEPTLLPPHNPDASRPDNTASGCGGSGLLASQEVTLQARCGCGSPMVVREGTAFCSVPLCYAVVANLLVRARRLEEMSRGVN